MQMRDPNQITTIRPNGTVRVQTINPLPSLTKQEFKEECDINNIMKKYTDNPQEFRNLTKTGGVYADFTGITDYQEMLDTVRYANDAFASLPANVRKRFNNDPAQLLEFIQDPKNDDEGVKLGLREQKIPIQKNDLNEKPTTTKKSQDLKTKTKPLEE